MFIKETKSKNHTYLQIVKSYRKDGKVLHQVIANLGRLDNLLNSKQINRLVAKLITYTKQSHNDISSLEEIQRLHYGHVVYKKIWEQFKLSELLLKITKGSKHRFDFVKNTFYLAVNRLLSPSSYKKSYENSHKFANLPAPGNLQHIYRSLDLLAAHKEKIEANLFEKQKSLFHMQLDVVFYDVTTFHFESHIVDALKDFGFSKNGKSNEVQVVLGLLINKEGLPIAFELFAGNTYDGSTLIPFLDSHKGRFQLQNVFIVADKAMHSKPNLFALKNAGYHYIVSSRIKLSSEKRKEQILDASAYTYVTDKETGTHTRAYQHIDNHFVYIDKQKKRHPMQDNLLISWSKERANRDLKKRNRMVEKAEAILTKGQQDLTRKKGAYRYIQKGSSAKAMGLDVKQIQKDAKWDGFYAVQYSGRRKSGAEIMKLYRQLWRIEECFRVLKTTMRTRPAFVLTPKRIAGHFVLCFLSFLLERTLEKRLKASDINLSPERIKESLLSLQISEIKVSSESFYLKGKNDTESNRILRILRIKPIKNLTPKQAADL